MKIITFYQKYNQPPLCFNHILRVEISSKEKALKEIKHPKIEINSSKLEIKNLKKVIKPPKIEIKLAIPRKSFFDYKKTSQHS